MNVEGVILGCSGFMKYFFRLKDLDSKSFRLTPTSDFKFDKIEIKAVINLKYNSLYKLNNGTKSLGYYHKHYNRYKHLFVSEYEILSSEDNQIEGIFVLDNKQDLYDFIIGDDIYSIDCEDMALTIIDPDVFLNTETRKLENHGTN